MLFIRVYGRVYGVEKIRVPAEDKNMSKICSVCGKGKLSGNLVSHSNRKTPVSYDANLQKVSVKHADGKVSKEYVCARCLKSGKVERA